MSKFKISVVIRAVGAGALALGSKAFALTKGAGGGYGAVKGLTGLALGGGAAAALASSNPNESNENTNAVSIKTEQKLPNVALSQQKEEKRLSARR